MLHCSHRVPETPHDFTDEMLINDAVVHEFDVIRYLTGEEIKNVKVGSAGLRVIPTPASTIRSMSFSRLRMACSPMSKSSLMRNSGTSSDSGCF